MVFGQLRLSYQMTVAAFKMTARYPASLLVALGNLVFLTFIAVGPLSFMIYQFNKDPEQAYEILKYVFQFWIVDNAVQAGDAGGVVSAFILWALLIYFVWMSIVTFGSLYTATVIMHTGVQQLKGQAPSLGEGFGIANRNILRLAGLAVIAGFLLTLAKRFGVVLRAIPILGRFIRKAIVAAITGTLYLVLPVVVYERNGPWSAFRNTFTHVRKTWGGLVVGTGMMLTALWVGLWFVWYMVLYAFESMTGIAQIDWSTILILQLIGAVLLYCLNVALSANLRAALYLHVVEGHTGVIPQEAFANQGAAQTPAPSGGAPDFQLRPGA